jgi:hypothetical protein
MRLGWLTMFDFKIPPAESIAREMTETTIRDGIVFN